VPEERYHVPGQRFEQREDRDALRFAGAPHDVLVTVREHDDIALVRPMALPFVDGDPARAAGDDVEEDQTFGVGDEGIRKGERRGLERERLRELGAEEQGSVEAQVLERVQQRRLGVLLVGGGTVEGGHGRKSGVAASTCGVSVMGFLPRAPDTAT